MKTELVDISTVEKEIKIEIDPQIIKVTYQKIVQKFTKMVTVQGFRKGFAPADIVKVRYKSDIKNEVIREVLPNAVTEAIQEHNLQPLREPDIHIENQENVKLNGTESVHLHVHVEIMPTIEVPEYKGLEGVRRVRPVEETEIDEIIEERRKEQASLEPVERKAKDGDTVIVDLKGNIVGDKNSEPIEAENLEILLGDSSVEETFNVNLREVEPDDVKTFVVDYPEDYSSAELAGKSVEYTATITSVGEVVLPEANDEWAQSLEDEFKSMADLRKTLRKDMETMAKSEADNRLRNELMKALIDKNVFLVPPTLIDIQAQNLVQNFAQDVAGRGIDPKVLQKEFWQSIYKQTLPQAESEVRGAFLLGKIAEVENIDASAEEINAEIETMANYYHISPEQIRADLKKQGNNDNSVAESIRNRKTIDLLVENAKISDGEWIDPEVLQQAEFEARQKKIEAEKVSNKTEENEDVLQIEGETKPKKKAAKAIEAKSTEKIKEPAAKKSRKKSE